MFSHLFGRACERLGYFLLQLLWPGREAQQSTAFSLPIIKSCWIFFIYVLNWSLFRLQRFWRFGCGEYGSFFLFFCNGRALCFCCCCFCLQRLFIYLFNCKRLWRFYEYDSHVPYTNTHTHSLWWCSASRLAETAFGFGGDIWKKIKSREEIYIMNQADSYTDGEGGFGFLTVRFDLIW